MKKRSKISSTAYRVLLLMLLLSENSYSIDELIDIFSNDPYISRSFTKEVILKYINTLRSLNFEITRINSCGKYTMVKTPFTIDLSDSDIKTIALLENYVSYIHNKKLKNIYSNLVEKIVKFLPPEKESLLEKERQYFKNNSIIDVNLYSKYPEIIQKYEKLCEEDQQIIIKYKPPEEKNQIQLIVEPRHVKYENNQVYLCGYNVYENEKQLFLVDYITDIKQLPQKSKNKNVLPSVVLQLKGKLVRSYRKYDGDKIINLDENKQILTISNSYEDKNKLFKRILRYGDSCEIIYPKSLREEYSKIINNILKNYEN